MHLIYKALIVSFFSLLLSVPTFAQKNKFETAHISAGIKGGYYSSTIGFYPAINSVPKAAPSYGVVFKYHAEKNFGAQIEVNYASIGWTELNRFDVEQEIYERSMDYVQIPFLTHIYIGKKKLQVFITLGPQFDILLSESKNVITDLDDQTYDYYDKEAAPFTVSLAGGGGINYITKFGHFQLEGRFSASMMNVLENEVRTSTDRSTAISGGITFSYLIPIRGWKNKPKNEKPDDINEPPTLNWEKRD